MIRVGLPAALMLVGFSATAQAAVVTFQQGAANALGTAPYAGTEDVALSQRFPSDNGGGHSRLLVGTSHDAGGTFRSLLRFDVSGLAGRYQTVRSVVLRLTYASPYEGQANVAQAFAVSPANAGWVEGSEDGMDGLFNLRDWFRPTWRFRVQGETADTGVPWAGGPASPNSGPGGGLSIGGTDYLDADGDPANGMTPLTQRSSASVAATAGTVFDLTVGSPAAATALVDTWLATGGNAGLLLRAAGEPAGVDSRFVFASREYLDPAWRPQLVVEYEVPEPGAVATVASTALVGLLRRRRPLRGRSR